MNGLSLFSGIGGLDVALSEWVRPVVYCEIDPYCQGVLLSRMVSGDLPEAPIWDDIKTLRIQSPDNSINILYGGFPCQDISIAGNGKGLAGERSGLFFEIVRLAEEIKPKFIFLENVPAITSRGGLQVVKEIAEMGYDCRWCVISAASIGALHKRERFFLLGHANSMRKLQQERGEQEQREWPCDSSKNVADTNDKRSIQPLFQKLPRFEEGQSTGCSPLRNTEIQSLQQEHSATMQERSGRKAWGGNSRECWPFTSREHWQKTVCEMGKLSDGLPNNVDRLRALGNSVVPCQAREAFRILSGIAQKDIKVVP